MSNLSLRFVIIHGTGGSPQGNWFPWLADQLRGLAQDVTVPQFPTGPGQNLASWLEAFNAYAGPLTREHVLIGHSIGAAFVLRLLERSSLPVAGAVLVAPFARQLGIPDFDPLNETFVRPAFKWTDIRKGARCFKVYSGDNDPYVPLHLGEEVAREIGCGFSVVEGGGHLNAESGYLRFDLLLRDLKPLMA